MTDVLGRPVIGKVITTGRDPQTQAPDEDFIAALDKLLAFPGVGGVRWDQYTPYFNDGDACEFSVNDYSVAVQWEHFTEADDDEYEDGWLRHDEGMRGTYTHNTSASYAESYDYVVNGHSTRELFDATSEFTKALGTQHEIFLKKSFGDHATVTATPAGFDVEFYEHD